MKYLIKVTAVKFNHKVYEIGDEITLTNVPKSLTHLLEPVKDLPARRSSGRVIPAEMPESKKPVILSGAEVSKKPKKRKKTEK